MNRERMEKMEILLRRIAPQVIPCPRSMILDALQTIAVEFFRETEVWEAVFQDVIGACETIFTPMLPKECALVNVKLLSLNGEDVNGFSCGTRNIVLNEPPRENSLVIAKCSLRPLRTATTLPEDLIEEHGDTLAFGAIAKLKAMSGQNVEWSDQQGASVNYQLYQDGSVKAKSRKYRKRLGGGVLYVNSGE